MHLEFEKMWDDYFEQKATITLEKLDKLKKSNPKLYAEYEEQYYKNLKSNNILTHYLNIGNCIFKNPLLLIRIKVINKSIKNLTLGKRSKEQITKLKHGGLLIEMYINV